MSPLACRAGWLATVALSLGCSQGSQEAHVDATSGSRGPSPAAVAIANQVRRVGVVAARAAGAARAPDVRTALRASGGFRIAASEPAVWLESRVAGTSDSAGERVDDITVFRGGGPGGSHWAHVLTMRGIDDFVVFERAPQAPEVTYRLALGDGVAGLRLVANQLELLDGGGTPRLRVASPSVVDARGATIPATLDLVGCAADPDPRPPWGRPTTEPGARHCEVRVRWDGGNVAYPAVLDPSWTTTGAMAVPRTSHAASSLLTGQVLVAGGNVAPSTTPTATAEIFDPTSATWSSTSSMARSRSNHGMVLLPGGNVLAAGGTIDAVTEIFSPATGLWTPGGNMSAVRSSFTMTRLGSGKVLVAGGALGTTAMAGAELYDPVATLWTPAAPLFTARSQHAAAMLNDGRVLIAGGMGTAGIPIAGAETFDASAGAWSPAAPMGRARYFHTATLLPSGRVLVAAGATSGGPFDQTAEEYDPSINVWSATADLVFARALHTATLLGSGKVLLAGGWTAEAELYDPVQHLWLLAPSMKASRSQHTATLLASGGVLVAGAAVMPGGPTSEVYSPSPIGKACSSDWECLTGFCSDGVCCSTRCSGACDVCASSLGATTNGTCAPVPGGSAGTPSCSPYLCDGVGGACPASCLADSSCVAGSYCRPSDSTCRPAQAAGSLCTAASQCQSGFCVEGRCCNSSCDGICQSCAAAYNDSGIDGVCGHAQLGTDPRGTCADEGASSCHHDGSCDGSGACRFYPAATPCGPDACSGNAPSLAACNGFGSCVHTSESDCAPYRCSAGTCPTTCTSGADCLDLYWCDAGTCRPQTLLGEPCTSGAPCQSGLCVDGVCCEAPCSGQCESCNATGSAGTCVPTVGAPRNGRPACAAAEANAPCSAATCDGSERAACLGFVGPEVSCGDASCTAGVAVIAAACDGMGLCATSQPQKCEPFACGATACNTTCAVNDDCAAGYQCLQGKCLNGTLCDGDHTLTRNGAAPVDCSPFKCDANGTCKHACGTVDDCAAPNVCDSTGRCSAPNASDSGGGCGCVVPGGTSGRWRPAWLALGLCGLLVGRRRRRADA